MARPVTNLSPEAAIRRERIAERKRLGIVPKKRIFAKDLTPEQLAARQSQWGRTSYARRTGRSLEQVRGMASQIEMRERLEKLAAIAAEVQPATVRQIYYRAEVAGLVGKDDAGYQKVAKGLTRLRLRGVIPWEWIRDPGRMISVPPAWLDVKHFLHAVKRSFRLDFWQHKNARVVIALEKDALASTVSAVTDFYRVPVMLARGTGSWALLHELATFINAHDGETYVYYLADFDPKGQEAANIVKQVLANKWVGRESGGKRTNLIDRPEDVHYDLIGLHSRQQVADMGLSTRPTKIVKVGKQWVQLVGNQSAELDAIDPVTLRRMVEGAITNHMTRGEAEKLHAKEARLTKSLVRKINRRKRSSSNQTR